VRSVAEAGLTTETGRAWVRRWVLRFSSSSHYQISKGCHRAIAILRSHSLPQAARTLNMASVSLIRWWERKVAMDSGS
jgi:hypothetical protein